MPVDTAILTPVSLFLGALIGGAPHYVLPFTLSAIKIAFGASQARSPRGKPFTLISS